MTSILDQQISCDDSSGNTEDTIALRFERQVAAVPDKLAIVTEEISLTYRALDVMANRIAAAMNLLPSRHDRPIILLIKDEADRIAAMLGALKARRIFISLAPDSPEKWVAKVIEDSRTSHIIVDSSTRSTAELAVSGGVGVIEAEQLARSMEPFVADRSASPDDTAYIVYTSGSTGRPKGVACSHRRIVGSLDARTLITGLELGDRYANLRSSGVSSWLRNSFSPLLSGACLLPFDVRRHALQKLTAWLVTKKITYISFSGSLLRTWLASLPDDLRFPALRFLEATGEVLYAQDVIRIARHLEGDWRIGHTYSSTECGVIAAQVFTSVHLPDAGVVAVGRPADGVEVCIKDETDSLVPPGEIGEIVVRSRFLAQGYWNDAELTAKAFQTDPLDNKIRTYRTGDFGRWRSDGTLEHVGRKGRRIRLRGYNIEPFQVESELLRQPGVTDAVVTLYGGADGQQPCLVGYIIAPPNTSPSAVRKGLGEHLPSYMVPSHIVILDSFPIATSGKIDREALPAPEGRSPGFDVSYVAPRTPTEEVLASIWREVLNVRQVGVHDNFFELGGHSLLAMQVVARLAKLLKFVLPLQRFFETPTISALASELQKKQGAAELGSIRSNDLAPATDNPPLSFGQQRLWFLDRLLPNKATYNIPRAWHLRGPLDARALERSLNHLVARHETLRTRFTLKDEPVQVIGPARAVALLITDLSAMSQSEREARAHQIIDLEARQPFDLEAGPPIRTQLVRLGSEEHLLMLNMHHIVSDGWSMGVLLRELSIGYTAFLSGQAPHLPELPIQYAEYAVRQRKWLQGEVLQEQLAYWKEKLADLSPLELQTDRPRPPMASNQGAHFTLDLAAPQTQALKTLSRRKGATLFMTLLAAFQVLLHSYSGQEDIAVGTPIAGRGHTELEGLIGFFVNTLVMRSNLAGNPAFTELLEQVRENALGAYIHQDLPFDKLVEELSSSRDMSRNPLFQVMFALQNAPETELNLRGVQASRLPLAGDSAKFDLTVTVRETAAGLHIRWEYSTDLFYTSTVERMARRFNMLLEGIVADAEQRIHQLLVPTGAERHQSRLESKTWREDSYPLSSLQQGMLFHAMWEKRSGVDIAQIIFDLHETLDVEKFKRAWWRIIARHPILRTSFHWNTLDEPQQQVHSELDLPWQEEDWQALTDVDREKRLADFLTADRRRGFDTAHAPLFRLTLVRYGQADKRLIWTYHHIILDGRSRRLLQHEVFKYYRSFLQGEDLDLPQPPPFRDYVEWLQRQDFRDHESFWRRKLKGFTAATRLSVDAPKLSMSSENRSGIQETKLSREMAFALRSIAERNAVTLATVVQAAWGILLSRYSGEIDVVFGLVCSNRRGTIEGAEDVIGLCINTLPMRVHVNSQIPIASLLKVVREQWMAMRDHVHTPLVEIQGWSEVPAGEPLFATVVSFQNYQTDPKLRMQGGASSTPEVHIIELPNYPVSLLVNDGLELQLTILYDRNRIDDGAARRMTGHFRTLLEGIAADPHQKVAALPLLTPSERQQLLLEWNETEVDYPRDKCVHQLFEAQVKRTPDAVAVVFGDQDLSYAELNARSNQFARYLQRHGARPGSYIACRMERSLELIITLLAILKLGGAYVALDTSSPARRLHSILEDASPAVIVVESVQEHAAIESIRLVDASATASFPRVICFEHHAQSIGNENAENLDSRAGPEDQAYVCFTSGSSGEPKGVCISHRAIVRLVKNTTYVSLSASDIFLQFAPVSFDASTFEIWGSLLNGAQLVVLPSEMPSLAQLGSAIRNYNISVLWLTAGLFNQIVDHELDSLSGVRQLLVGGDVLSITHVRKALTRLGEGALINGYGPTENTTFTCCYPIRHLSAEEHAVPIGRPISNTQCFILDSNLQPVPIGVRGELFAGGDGLALGYLNDPKLTAENFVPNPFRPGSVLYRTGDFARYRSDGNIEFLGRVDNQVKIRGYRIELGEIELALKRHSSAKEVVVVAREAAPGDRRLVAYVSPASAAPQSGELREFLKKMLPAYMLPSSLVFVDTFPLTANGKLDRRALATFDPPSPAPSISHKADSRSIEGIQNRLLGLWKSLLGAQPIGLEDDFFELGGHSLLASRLLAQIEKEFGVRLPLATIFQTPTVGKLADAIRRSINSPYVNEKPALFCTEYGVALSKHLELDLPVYQLYRDPEIIMTHGFIETLAASYVDEIRKIQLAGPYFVSGYSAGGIVAYEIAQQLLSQGEEVGLLAIVETMPFVLRSSLTKSIIRRLTSFAARVPWRRPSRWFEFMLGEASVRRLADKVRGRPDPAWKQIFQLQAHYKPKPYVGRITVFLSDEEANVSKSLREGWATLAAGDLEMIVVPGDHYTMVEEPHVRVLAKRIKERLPS
jgi:amino acid adenylation domain-containing protein